MTISTITPSQSSSEMFWMFCTWITLRIRMITASGRKNSAMQKRESTKSRTKRRTGPLSRAYR